MEEEGRMQSRSRSRSAVKASRSRKASRKRSASAAKSPAATRKSHSRAPSQSKANGSAPAAESQVQEEKPAPSFAELAAKSRELLTQEIAKRGGLVPNDPSGANGAAFRLDSTDASFNSYLGGDNSNLFSLEGDGFKSLFSGARTNYGIKAGQYVFEVKMLEHPRGVRVGFSTGQRNDGGDTGLLYLDEKLDDSEELAGTGADKTFAVGFDCQGELLFNGHRSRGSHGRFLKGDVVQVVLNLDDNHARESANRNSVSLFVNGKQQGKPRALPEALFCIDEEQAGPEGQVVRVLRAGCEFYPTVCGKGSAVECNFSAKPWFPLVRAGEDVGVRSLADAASSGEQQTEETAKSAEGEDNAEGNASPKNKSGAQEKSIEQHTLELAAKGTIADGQFVAEPYLVRGLGSALKGDVVRNPRSTHNPAEQHARRVAEVQNDTSGLSAAAKQQKIAALERDYQSFATEVFLPIGFDNGNLVRTLKRKHPDAIELTLNTLGAWAAKSGFHKQVNHGGKYNLACIDNPALVLPSYLKKGKKYIISFQNNHNFLPKERAVLLGYLRHGLNTRVTAFVDVDGVKDYTSGKRDSAASSASDLDQHYFQQCTLPTMHDAQNDVDALEYVYSQELEAGLVARAGGLYNAAKDDFSDGTQEEIAPKKLSLQQYALHLMVDDAMNAWRRDCKLKSRIEGFKRGEYYTTQYQKYVDMKRLLHKNTAGDAKKKIMAERDAKRAQKEKEKRSKLDAKRVEKEGEMKEERARRKKERQQEIEELKLAGVEIDSEEEAARERAAEDEEKRLLEEQLLEEDAVLRAEMEVDVNAGNDELDIDALLSEDAVLTKEAMDAWSEEDWMLAQLRTELHAMLHSFSPLDGAGGDSGDPERLSFPLAHVGYYYQAYTGTSLELTLRRFGCKHFDELTRLVPEVCKHTRDYLIDDCTMVVPDNMEGKPLLGAFDLVMPGMPQTVQIKELLEMTEKSREMRSDRLDAGDENAALTFSYNAQLERQAAQMSYGMANGGLSRMGSGVSQQYSGLNQGSPDGNHGGNRRGNRGGNKRGGGGGGGGDPNAKRHRGNQNNQGYNGGRR